MKIQEYTMVKMKLSVDMTPAQLKFVEECEDWVRRLKVAGVTRHPKNIEDREKLIAIIRRQQRALDLCKSQRNKEARGKHMTYIKGGANILEKYNEAQVATYDKELDEVLGDG